MTDTFPKTKPFKDTLAYEGIKKIWKIATKNMIPSDPEKVLEMEKRLMKEDKLKQDVTQAKIHIKEIFKQRKIDYKEVKRLRRLKIKMFIMKLFRKKIKNDTSIIKSKLKIALILMLVFVLIGVIISFKKSGL